MLEKTTRINYLFDFYQELLTPKQKNYMELYYLEDYSLGEISETYDVSRQAVYDNIRRTEAMLEEYEEKLGLYRRFEEQSRILEEMRDSLSKEDLKRVSSLIEELENLD
ncbi:putative DNA-binding protein [Piscibacillus halophilus]|uniref:putative DNA-binding protein n=1 Tax=Piscibacillus halophilus TaxID=571933 RepID=UPI002409129B|nr:putative DNA-binding protein [Piscibacillus halophilus]